MERTRRFGVLELIALLGAVGVAALLACSDNTWVPDDGGTDGDADADSDSEPSCIDSDGDGYGRGCPAGPDCDDTDPTVNEGCVAVEIGGGEHRWDPDESSSSGVVVDDEGWLTLSSRPDIQPAVWVANSAEGTVSRLDSRTGREVARYASALSWMSGARPWSEGCSSSDGRGNCPSRTAIDFRGDCWVANRAFGTQGTTTKIASRIEDCIDRNGNGEIETSRDLDGDGIIDLDSEEFLGEDDECILFTVDVGGRDGIPRALAIAPDFHGSSFGGNAWVGLNGERRFAELAGETGEVLRYVDVPLNPYGALASKYEGRVWMTNAGWQRNLADNPPGIAAIDLRTGEVTPRFEVSSPSGCESTYGLTIDYDGRVWVAGRECEGAFRFDPDTETWMTVDVPESGVSRGLVADADGYVWLAHCRNDSGTIGLISRFRQEDGSDLAYYHLPTGLNSIGVDIDVDGRVWTINGASHNAARIDPVSGTIDEFPVGRGPYTYSDFTGHSLLLQFPRGYYRDVVEVCPGAEWRGLSWRAELPGDTVVELRLRSAPSRIELGAVPWVGPFTTSPASLTGLLPAGAFLELEIILISRDEIAVPRVRWVEATYECPVG